MKTTKMAEWDMVSGFGVLTINNPPQNYLDELDFFHLEDVKKWMAEDPIKGLIITGKGRHFSAGANKEKIFQDQGIEVLSQNLHNGKKIAYFIEELTVPTIAAINGVCFGGGLELALSAHIRVCSNKSLFSFPETRLGLIPGLNGVVRLPKLIGLSKSLDMVLSCRMVDASEALELGLVDYVVPRKEVFDFSIEFLKKLNKDKSINVVNSAMKSFNNYRKKPFAEASAEETILFSKLVIDQQKKIILNL